MANKNKGKKLSYRFSKVSIIVFLTLAILLTIFAFVFKKPIENAINYNNVTNSIDYDGLVMHTIDVGQAEAIMIKLPDGKNMLVDSGNRGKEKNDKLKSYLINNYFNSVENKEIDYFVLTHSDADHIGGAIMIFDTFQVNKVFRPNLFADVEPDSSTIVSYTKHPKALENQLWGKVVQKMYAEPNCEIEFSKAGIQILESNYSIKFCAPTENYYSKINSYSPIIQIEYASRRILLTGDATTDTEQKAMANLSKCDILKVGHHGSETSTGEEFLEKVKPTYAIISANSNDSNKYGLPKQIILNRLVDNGVLQKNIFRTDLNGNIVLTISQESEINFILDVQNNSYYIRIEYLLCGGYVILFVVCFSLKKKVKK